MLPNKRRGQYTTSVKTMRSSSREAWLAKVTTWAQERNAVGPGSWSSYNRDFLQKLQQAGDPFLTGVAQGVDLFNSPSWGLEMDDKELTAQRLQANLSYSDPFEDLIALSVETSFIPAPFDPNSNPLRGPGFGGGLNSSLQNVPQSNPLIGAPLPVSSNALGAANAPEFMNPDPRLKPKHDLPQPGSMTEMNPETPTDVPSIVPPPPGGPIPPPPLPGPSQSSEESAERKAARDIIALVRRLAEGKKGTVVVQPEKPPQPSSGFPDRPELSNVIFILALRIREFSQPKRPVELATFQQLARRLTLAYEGAVPFVTHLRNVENRIENAFKSIEIERLTKVLFLPFDGDSRRLYPWLASELIAMVNTVRDSLAAAEILAANWSAPVTEQNFQDLSKEFEKQLDQSTQILINLWTVSEKLNDNLTASSVFPLPSIGNLQEAYDVFEKRPQNMADELKLWRVILDQSIRVPGVDYSAGLDNPILSRWIRYTPLTSRFNSITEALLVAFRANPDPEIEVIPNPAADQAIREFVSELDKKATLLQNEILRSIIARFSDISEVSTALLNRALNGAVVSEQNVVGLCVETLLLQAQTFNRLSTGASIFSTPDESSAQKKLVASFKGLWKISANSKLNPSSMRTLLSVLTQPNLAELLPEGFGEKKAPRPGVRGELDERFHNELFWHNSCEQCGLASDEFCALCVVPFCNLCMDGHQCTKEPSPRVDCWSRAALITMCKVMAPPNVAQLVLHDQAIHVGAQTGQLLGFEYPCLQATQLPTNANLFHLLSIKCTARPLDVRYLRVTIHSVLPIGENDPLHILINGARVKSKTYFGQVDGRAPLLRSRSLVIPENAQVSWSRETDEAWLHGDVANIALDDGMKIDIRLQLPVSLQPLQVLTKNVTASLEIVLTAWNNT